VPAVVANRRSWPPILAAGGVYTTLITFLGLWGVPYLTQVYGLARVDAATIVSMLAVGMGIGSPVAGWLSDRWLGRRRLPMLLFAALYAACWAPLVLPGELRLPAARLYPPAAFQAVFSVCLALAAGAVLAAVLVTETRGRNVWQAARD